MSDVYRKAASVVLLRPVSVCAPGGACSTIYEVLLLKKPRKRDAWQLPQGGAENEETMEQAALRELYEEAGIAGVTILGVSTMTYQYAFPPSFRRFRPDNVCGQSIGFVFALAKPGETVRVDGKEIESSVWILPEQLPLYIKRKEYLEMVAELVKEAISLVPRSEKD